MQFSRFITESRVFTLKPEERTITDSYDIYRALFLNAFFLIIIILPLVLLYSLNFLRTNMVTET